MVRDLNVPVVIVAHPTVREADGLAMSSRNVRLNATQRADAPRLRQALLAAQARFRIGIRTSAELLVTTRQAIEDSALTRIDYLSLVDAETLVTVANIERPALLATAVFYSEVRLIDHVCLVP